MSRVTDSDTFELLVRYLRMVKDHLEYLDERGGIIEEAVAQAAETEMTFALEDLNALRVASTLEAPRDAVGDVVFLLRELLAGAQRREAMMETFEAVRDTALQQTEVARTAVRVAEGDALQRVIDYCFRAQAMVEVPASVLPEPFLT